MDELLKLIERVEIVEKRALIRSFLKKNEVTGQIAEMGLTQEEANAGVNALTDTEVLQIAEKVQQIPDCGAIGRVSEAVDRTALPAIVFLLFLILISI